MLPVHYTSGNQSVKFEMKLCDDLVNDINQRKSLKCGILHTVISNDHTNGHGKLPLKKSPDTKLSRFEWEWH